MHMVVRISIIDQRGSFRLIRCASLGYAVVEARGGGVYSLDGAARRRCEDSETGMAEVVGAEGWCDRRAARRRFDRLVLAATRMRRRSGKRARCRHSHRNTTAVSFVCSVT
jgi:hypothetical protein